MAESVKNLNSQNEILKLPYLVLVVSLLLSVGITFIFYQSAQARDAARFQSEVTNVKNRIEILLSTYVAVIKAGRGFIDSTDAPNREQFADFINSLELVKNYRGVQGIGFAKRVLPGERIELIKKMQSGGLVDFKMFPDGERAEYHTILFIEPTNERNVRAVGYDMSADPTRLEAMESARDTGDAAMTGKVDLGSETEAVSGTGFLIYVPVYKDGKIPVSLEERRRLLDGYVFSLFQAKSFLQDIQKNISADDIAITIYDGEKRLENILAQTVKNRESAAGDLIATSEVAMAGRNWIVQYETQPGFVAQSSAGWTPLIFIGGLIFSLLLFGMTYLESNARVKAENITSELQESEKEKAFLLEREQTERRRAEDAGKSKDEFISIVSHELRTPLNAIAGWSKILYADNLSPATKKQALQKIDKNLRVQTEIVEELLDFTQILAGKSDLVHQEFDFSKMFEETIQQASGLAGEKGLLLEWKNSLNGGKFSGDRERLQKVIKNLISNAVKFTPKGGKISAEVKENDLQIEFSVTDTGQGIDGEFLPYIFERFKQADSSTTRRHGGLGLGLAISSHIVKLHGGNIEASSEGAGKGAAFVVKLPFTQ